MAYRVAWAYGESSVYIWRCIKGHGVGEFSETHFLGRYELSDEAPSFTPWGAFLVSKEEEHLEIALHCVRRGIPVAALSVADLEVITMNEALILSWIQDSRDSQDNEGRPLVESLSGAIDTIDGIDSSFGEKFWYNFGGRTVAYRTTSGRIRLDASLFDDKREGGRRKDKSRLQRRPAFWCPRKESFVDRCRSWVGQRGHHDGPEAKGKPVGPLRWSSWS